MKKVLITGHTGMLGQQVVNEFIKEPQFDVYGLSTSYSSRLARNKQIIQDLTHAKSNPAFLKDFQFDIIIHTAAFVNLEFCEQNPELSAALHVESTRFLAEKFSNALFIYISTDSVFNGVNGNYTEIDKPDPLNVYAKTKYLGELAARSANPNTIIIRTNIVGHPTVKASGLFAWALNNLNQQKEINGFTNVYFNPLSTGILSNCIKQLIIRHSDYRGIINMPSNDFVSKFEFLKFVAVALNVNQNLVKPVIFKNDGIVKRPLNTTLNGELFYRIMQRQYGIQDVIDDLRTKI